MNSNFNHLNMKCDTDDKNVTNLDMKLFKKPFNENLVKLSSLDGKVI